MASWIEEKADQVKRAEEAWNKAREWQLHAAQVIRSRIREIAEELERAVRSDVDKWNAILPEKPKQIDDVFKNIPNGFKVHKTYFPSFGLAVTFDGDSQSIYFEAIKNEGLDLGSCQTKGRFGVALSENGAIYLTHRGNPVSFTEASQILLEPLLSEP